MKYLIYLIAIISLDLPLISGDFEVKIIDSEGAPVEGASVHIAYFDIFLMKDIWFDVETDSAGIVSFRGSPDPDVTAIVTKEGYYETIESFSTTVLGDNGFGVVMDEHKAVVLLKEVRNPIPMHIGGIYEKEIPGFGVPIGYDFEASDWVIPYGVGKNTHMLVTISGHRNKSDYYRKLEISFPNKGDGLVPFKVPATSARAKGSKLKSDYDAPNEGYVADWTWIRTSKGNSITNEYRRDYQNDISYYIRVNTVLNSKGEVVSANYGKIYGDIKAKIYSEKEAEFSWGRHYLNPNTNDTNVEFDPRRPIPDSLLDEIRKERERDLKLGLSVTEPKLRVAP